MRLIYLPLVLALSCLSSLVSSQNCLPAGIHFENQQDIDDFATNYPGCTVIEGDVCIGSCDFSASSNISNLNGLAQLTKVLGTLTIANNPSLISLEGLENMTVFENDVIIRNNDALASLDALQQVEHMKGSFEVSFNSGIVSMDGFELVDTIVGNIKLSVMFGLTSLTAFPNLRYLGGLYLFSCNELVDLPDMVNLEYFGGLTLQYNEKLTQPPAVPLISVVDGEFIIEDNFALTGVIGYENIIRINGDVFFGKEQLEIRDKALWNINAFHNLSYVGGNFNISRSISLVSIDAFTQLDSIGGHFSLNLFDVESNFPQHNRFHFIGDDIYFTNIDSLQNLLCLSELDSIRGGLSLSSLSNLTGFEGIEHITEIGGTLELGFLNLEDLSGLSHVTYIGGSLRISDMDLLTDLSGLENVSSIDGMLFIFRNGSLESLMGIENIDPQSIHFDFGTEIIIEDNTQLTECSLHNICQALRVYDKSYRIENNGPGCSDITEILCFDFGLSGIVYYDENLNKIQDADERGIRNNLVNIDGGTTTATTNSLGQYLFFAEEGSEHTMSLDVMDGWILTTDSVSYTQVFNEGAPTNDDNDFGVYPLVPSYDLEVNLSSASTRCNSTVNFFLNYLNTGTSDKDGKIVLIYDDIVNYSQATPPPTFHDVGTNELIWQFDTLDAYEARNVLIKFSMPDETFEGEYVDFLVEGYIDSSGTDVLKDTFVYSSDIRCAIDPNDKIVSPPGSSDENFTLKDGLLTYTVRFENEGNAEAIDITVRDTLDADLDMSTFRVLNSSFPVLTTFEGHAVTFFFRNIWLQPAQQGFVTYEIKPVADLPDFTIIENYAGIIFDFNQPIITNTTLNTLLDEFCLDITVVIDTTICEGTSFLGYTETGVFTEEVSIGLCDSITLIFLTVEETEIYIDTSICEGENIDGYDESGIYFYTSTDPVTGCETEVQLLLTIIPTGTGGCITGTNDASENQFKIYPNPVSKELFVESEKAIESLMLFTADGCKVDFERLSGDEKKTRVELKEGMSDGFYILVIRQDGLDYFEKIVVCR